MTSLYGQTALVTGAAGGIGAATCRALAAAGADIIVNHWRTPEAADALAADFVKMGRRACAIEADVGDEIQVEAMFSRIDRESGRLDILVNNAGIARPEDIFQTTLESWNEVIRINLTGSFLCARAAMLRMREAGRGRIVQIGSVVAHQGALMGHTHYGASKSGAHGLARTLARTAAKFGITVNTVAPGIVATPMLTATHGEDGVRELQKLVPVGALATPDDVAAAILYLCGEEARHVTGAVIDVNGGMHMR